ncbi:threonine/serine exporter family protein [Caloramator sp. ALD01]|uniref:threonine/serine exporter family protein n=1 Tax=Caloramator sp. ALD01 TaxID=1031288 RepID=UPI00040B25D1|nr:threonine/serine exporter family protein [Caloramator sp. ALD01]
MMDFILAFIGSFAGAILFNIERKNLVWAGLCGGISWVVFKVLFIQTDRVVFSTFLAAFACGIYSEAMARKRKTPAFVFSIPGIYPLVPGITAYTTVRAIVEGRLVFAANKGIETIGTAGAIAFGIMLATTAFQFIYKVNEKYTKKPKITS